MAVNDVVGKCISELTLEELFPETLTDTSCVYVDKEREVWVVTEMCAQYLESVVDSIVVVNADGIPLGIVGGYDLLDNLRKNPTRAFQYEARVDDIMFGGVPEVDKGTKLGDLVSHWKNTRRAFAILSTASEGYSPISARKMLEVGTRCKTDIQTSSLPKKKTITFKHDDTLGKIIELMFEHKTRKLMLENSNQFISDRLILGEISRMLKFQKNVDNFLDVPASQLKLEYVKTVGDIPFDYLCSIMGQMDHPFVMYNDVLISPWDVCLILTSESMRDPLRTTYAKRCPHCAKEI